jgi:hypothetical protein
MNSIVTLTTGEKVDVRDFVGYSVEATPKGVKCELFLKGCKVYKVTEADIECIEVFRKELNEIKRDEER